MQYFIKRDNPLSQFIQLELHLFCQAGETVELQLPAWRPGRYELANYAQKIRKLKAEFNRKNLTVHKLSKDLWTFTAKEEGSHHIIYEFHANQMDAGGSWSDDEQLYLNFINFIFEVKGRPEERIAVEIDYPDNFKVATALPPSGRNQFIAANFQHLVDSPLMASPSLSHHHYRVREVTFHLWFQGKIYFDMDSFITVFQNFTIKQIEAFGDFPAKEYHFLFQLLPYKHYHGVEHQYSTVITLGPAEKLSDKDFLEKLIGVSSHELYHFWNVCRIRPEELMPYDFSKEAYIETGVVAEGVTTYMGDLYLLKSGYYTLEQYLKVLENLLNREFESFGWQTQSIVESSLDLWLDGYKAGIPDKKVSIYNRGALISLCLDLILLDHGSSLQEVMKKMYMDFGKTKIGYTLHDYKTTISSFLNDPAIMDGFFERFIYGTEDIRILLEQQLNSIGVRLDVVKRDVYLEGDLGIITDETGRITKIHPDAPAIRMLMLGDEIKELDGKKFAKNHTSDKQEVEMNIIRYGRNINLPIPKSKEPLYMNYKLALTESNIKTEKWIS
jgi:predicted metalloprotease with PDZ domain